MFLGSRVRPVRKADNLTAICGILNNSALQVSTACCGDSFTFFFAFYDLNYIPTTSGGKNLKRNYIWGYANTTVVER
jgi:hypothetical protein